MRLGDLSFIDEGRAIEVEAIDTGRSTSEFTFAPSELRDQDEEPLQWRAVDDVIEIGERRKTLPIYVELAKVAFQQRGLDYPFEIDESQQALQVIPPQREFAVKVAGLSRVVRLGNKDATNFEKRAFQALHTLLGGWGVCVGAPRRTHQMGAAKSIQHFRSALLPQEQGTFWPSDCSPNGDEGADGFLILGRGWGGPIAFYQSKNTGFDLECHPEEFSRIPSIAEDWFGKRVNEGRQIIPVLALNTVLSIELKEKIYSERGPEHGVHIVDAVDILAAEQVPPTHITRKCDCIVL